MKRPSDPVLGVVIPSYNEFSTIREILRRVSLQPIVREIVVVDDASTDGTREVLEDIRQRWSPALPPLKVILQDRNRGKGAALRTGFPEITSPLTIVQDADLEYDPREYDKLCEPILEGDADVVYGSRFVGFPRRALFYLHALGNRFLTTLSNLCTGIYLTDMETCYKVFRTDLLKSIPIRSNRFGFEPEITAKVARLGCRVYEVPISYRGRSYAEGKKIGWKDGFQALWVILKYRLIQDLGDAETGHRTLRLLRSAGAYNRWVYGLLKPHLGQRILEVGAGIGNMSRYFLGHRHLTISDRSPEYLEELRQAYGDHGNVDVRELDISSNGVPERGDYDSVVCINVLEHIEDDVAALRNMGRFLKPGGTMVIYVPATPAIYCEIDRGVGHYRRYTREELERKMEEAGFRVTHRRYHNLVGALGWWVNGKVLRKKTLGNSEVRGFSAVMPLMKLADRWECSLALSVLVVGRKPGGKSDSSK